MAQAPARSARTPGNLVSAAHGELPSTPRTKTCQRGPRLEAGAHIFEHLGHIFTQRSQFSTAARARIVIRQVGVNLARQVLGKWPAKWPRRRFLRAWHCNFRIFRGTGNNFTGVIGVPPSPPLRYKVRH
jgi:hypothetical protein